MAGSNQCASVKWQSQQLMVKPQSEVDAANTGDGGTKYTFNETTHLMKGIQTASYDTNFDQTPTFQFCNIDIYELLEGIPTVDLNITKIVDGWMPVYCAVTADATNPSLIGRAECASTVGIGIYACDQDQTDALTPRAMVAFPNMQINSWSMSMSSDGTGFTEDVSLGGNNVLWWSDLTTTGGVVGNGYLPVCGDDLSTTCDNRVQSFLDDYQTINIPGTCADGDICSTPKTKVATTEDLVFMPSSPSTSPDIIAVDTKFDIGGTHVDSNRAIRDPYVTVLPSEVLLTGATSTTSAEQKLTACLGINAVINAASNILIPDEAAVVNTASRERTSNVATIVTGVAHGLTTDDYVKIIGMGDDSYETASVQVTVTNTTTFTYPSNAADEANTPDVTGEIIPLVSSGFDRQPFLCLNSITVSTDLNREDVNCLGQKGPVTRTITPPISVTTAIEVISQSGAQINALEEGVFVSCANTDPRCQQAGLNLRNQTIRLVVCDGTYLYLGVKNKLQSVSTSGGSTDGDNLTVTYTYQNFNNLTVLHTDEWENNTNSQYQTKVGITDGSPVTVNAAGWLTQIDDVGTSKRYLPVPDFLLEGVGDPVAFPLTSAPAKVQAAPIIEPVKSEPKAKKIKDKDLDE